MANTTNTQKPRSFENVKTVKSNVLNVARALQQTLSNVKQRANALSETIQQKRIEFRQQEMEAAANELATQNEAAEVVQEPIVEPVVEPTVEEQQQPQTVEPTVKEEEKPAPTEEVKPKVSVETIVENGREIKKYTDEKGNIKIRTFIDLNPVKKTSSSGGNAKRERPQGGKSQGAGNKPSGKDDQGARSQQSRNKEQRNLFPQ